MNTKVTLNPRFPCGDNSSEKRLIEGDAPSAIMEQNITSFYRITWLIWAACSGESECSSN